MNMSLDFNNSPVILASLFLFAAAGIGAASAADLPDMFTEDEPVEVSNPAEYTGVMTVEHERFNEDTGEYETVTSYEDDNLIVDQGLNFFQCVNAGQDVQLWYDQETFDAQTPNNPETGDAHEWGDTNIDTRYDGEDYEQQLFITDENGHCPYTTTDNTGNIEDIESYATQPDRAVYLSLSDHSESLTASMIENPDEIQRDGLERVQGEVTDVGTGHYDVEFTFVAQGEFEDTNIQTTGLHWGETQGEDDLVAINSFPQVTMLANDRLTISWTEVSFASQE